MYLKKALRGIDRELAPHILKRTELQKIIAFFIWETA
jgi:hypothetical protein